MTKERRIFLPLTSENICEIYNLLHDGEIVSFPLTSQAENIVDGIVTNINGSNYGVVNYSSIEEKVVAYLYFLIKDHPFTDGNKRTAVLSFSILCRLNNLKTNLQGYDLDALAIFLEQEKNTNHQELIKIISEVIFK